MTTKLKRGFAAMNEHRQRDIASQGGIAAHRSGRAHQFSSEEASAAAKRGHQLRKLRKAIATGEVDSSSAREGAC